MDVNRLAGFGKDLHSRIRTFFNTPLDANATPLEIGQAVLDQVERQVQPVARGRRVFPFVGLAIRVRTNPASSAAMIAAFEDFATRVRERLAEVRCEAPRRLDVDVECLEVAPASWPEARVFDVSYIADEALPVKSPARGGGTAPVVHITVVAGTAVESSCRFAEGTVSIGRCADPADDMGYVRRNRIAFLDVVDGINETVGRAHARLRCDAVAGEVRLFDEGSRNGTSILRDGDVIAVHRRDPRGVRLRSGDEIRLGRALLRVEIDG
ncbi:FHA domain protein [Luteitalea pratensis]|uniref:FHA domain protein n=1 Tax=Luteitalea pratensis TaxID=1855912 RepID=A0A143PK74_LUTPR|nr:FHA domain-containing protein [Luteitalea pratensis]AMY08650.1 FHA domain protein [Luteitalea pratensis]